MFENLSRREMIEICEDLFKKMRINRVITNEIDKELYSKYNNLIYGNFDYDNAEDKMIGYEVDRSAPFYANELRSFYNTELLPYESYISLLNIDVNDNENIMNNFNKYIDLYTKLKKSTIKIDEDRCFNILYNLMYKEIEVLKTSKILDSFDEYDVLKTIEILNKKTDVNNKIKNRLSKDIIKIKDLREIMFEYILDVKNNNSSFNYDNYSEEVKKDYKKRLKELKQQRKRIIKTLEHDEEFNGKEARDELNRQIKDLKKRKKEINKSLKIMSKDSRKKLVVRFFPLEDMEVVATRVGVFLVFYSLLIPLHKRDIKEVEVNSTNTKNYKEYTETIDADDYKRELNLDFEENKELTILTYYSQWEYNGNDYQREIIVYTLDTNIDLNNIQDYLKENNVKIISKEIEHKDSLKQDDIYTEGYFEIDNTKYLLRKGYKVDCIGFVYIIVIIVDVFCRLLCALVDDDYYSNYISFPILQGVIPMLKCIKIKIDNGEYISEEEINELKKKLKELSEQIKEKRNELATKSNEKFSTEEIKEYNKELEEIDERIRLMDNLMKGIDNPELVQVLPEKNKSRTLSI